MAGHVADRGVALMACAFACDGSLEPPEKQMAGTCSCKSCCLGGCGSVGSVWGV